MRDRHQGTVQVPLTAWIEGGPLPMTWLVGKEDLTRPLRLLETDVGERPVPGWYVSTIATACWCRSSHDNRMVYLVVALDGVGSPYDRVRDYFVLEGVTPRPIACSRRRLVTVFRAAHLPPQVGDEIRPAVLEGLEIEVKLAHEVWNGEIRLQITGYRPLAQQLPAPGDDEETGEAAVGLPGTTSLGCSRA